MARSEPVDAVAAAAPDGAASRRKQPRRRKSPGEPGRARRPAARPRTAKTPARKPAPRKSTARQPAPPSGGEAQLALTEGFYRALAADFSVHGPASIAELRAGGAANYLRLVASALARDLPPPPAADAVTDAELAAAIRALAALGGGEVEAAVETAAAGRSPHAEATEHATPTAPPSP